MDKRIEKKALLGWIKRAKHANHKNVSKTTSSIKKLFTKQEKCEEFHLVLTGQFAVVKHIEKYEICQKSIEQMKKLLNSQENNVIFSHLEDAVLNEDKKVNTSPETQTMEAPKAALHIGTPSVLDILKGLGVNLLSASSNHQGDAGTAGMADLQTGLKERKIIYAGLGENLIGASAPCYFESDVGKVALVAFASKVPPLSIATDKRPGVNHLAMVDQKIHELDEKDVNRICDALAEAKKHADIVIAYHHNHYWVNPNLHEVTPLGNWQITFAHLCIDSGATMYVSHGTPRLMGCEIYKNAPIFYSLGNFFFQTGGHFGSEVWESVITYVHLDKKTKMINLVKFAPIQLHPEGDVKDARGYPLIPAPDYGKGILERFGKLCSEINGAKLRIDTTDPTNPLAYIDIK